VFFRVALVLKTISKVDQERWEGQGRLTRIKANVNGADIDNDQLGQNHEDEALSLLRALIDAIYFLKTNKADILAVIKKHCTELPKI
jgi:hypothetical protein